MIQMNRKKNHNTDQKMSPNEISLGQANGVIHAAAA
jgi:hypothetical protein